MIITPLSKDRILTVAQSLPAAPRIMAGLHQMLADSKSGLVEIASLLRRDVALTSRIIRIANSPAYNGGGLGSIEEAVQRVGFGEIFKLVGVAANAALADKPFRCYGYSADEFRTHNLCNALVCEGIAREVDEDARLAYTAGLLRCIGQLLLDRAGGDELSTSETFPEANGLKMLEWEQRTFGVTHLEVSGQLLREWGFPAAVIEAVGHHDGSSASPLGDILALSECVVNISGYGLHGEGTAWGIPQKELAAVGLTIDQVNAIAQQAVAKLTSLQAA